MKEKFFNEMFNFVKVFSFLIIVCSIVIISVKICETAKHDFKLKNIFKYFEDKRLNKKSKKDMKHQLKDFKIHYIDPHLRPPFIHTLMPLPLPVHLPPLPTAQNHYMNSREGPLPTLINNDHVHRLHLHHQHHHHIHPNDAAQMMAMESSQMLGPPLPEIIFHHRLHPISLPVTLQETIPADIVYPVFERIPKHQFSEEEEDFQSMAQLNDNDIHHGLGRVHPNAHSYGESDDTILDLGFDKYINTNKDDNHRQHRHKQNHKERDKNNDSDKTLGIRIVNNNRFKELYEKGHFIPILKEVDHKDENKREEDNKDQKKEDNRSNYRNTNNTNNNRKKLDIKSNQRYKLREDIEKEKKTELSSMSGKVVKFDKNFDSNSVGLDNKKQMDIKTTTEFSFPTLTVPDEQLVHMFEDKWTFKDLDLWVVR